jgi:hypothetical protein
MDKIEPQFSVRFGVFYLGYPYEAIADFGKISFAENLSKLLKIKRISSILPRLRTQYISLWADI